MSNDWTVKAGFEPVANVFREQLFGGSGRRNDRPRQIGAALTVFHQGQKVVEVFGGVADQGTQRPWTVDTRAVVFSVSKGLASMAFFLASAQGRFDWDAPVTTYWPGFAKEHTNKARITVRTLLNHRARLERLDEKLSLLQCARRDPAVLRALELQPSGGTDQVYHAITWGLYADELFRRITGEDLGVYLRRELFDKVGSDARLGDGPEHDELTATLYPPSVGDRVRGMGSRFVWQPQSAEARLLSDLPKPRSVGRGVISVLEGGEPENYNDTEVRRTCLPWAAGTSSATGLARAYLPFVSDGLLPDGSRLFEAASLRPLFRRQSWSECDGFLNKPSGWSQGFLKEERHLFCPNDESFGHPGLGGALGWADPVTGTTIGYVMNRMDWRIRSKRCVELCRALYECAPLLGASLR